MLTTYSVWVGGVELNAFYLNRQEARELANDYIRGGYEDVMIEEVTL